MIAGDEWDQPFLLSTPSGDLPINQPLGTTDTRRFQLNPDKCTTTLPVRVTEDDRPQGDGKIPHRRWRSGFGVHLAIEAFEEYGDDTKDAKPACGETLILMKDILGLHVNEMIRTGLVSGLPNARLIWTPFEGASDDRMFDRCQLQGVTSATGGGDLGGPSWELDIDTPFPYYISKTELETTIAFDGTASIPNNGNIDGFIVAQVYGPSTFFELINHSVVDLDGNPLKVVYFAALPGAEDVGGTEYLEFVFFRGTCYLLGDVARRLAGVDMRFTTYWPLVPGGNLIEIVGASAVILSNDYYA